MYNDIIHGKFIVQSSLKSPDYLIARINDFLLWSRDSFFSTLSDEQIEKSKHALINNLKQKDLSMSEEAHRYWTEIVEGYYEFDYKEKKIEALEKVNKTDLINFFNKLIFTNPKRMHVKLYSHTHY